MNAYIDCIGCEQRELDSQKIIDYLNMNDFPIINNPKEADYLIIVTCGVDGSSERRSAEKLGEISSKMKNSAKLLIGGCLPSINPQLTEKFSPYATFTPQTMDDLDQLLSLNMSINEISTPNKSVYDKKTNLSEESARTRFDLAKQGYKIKISEGCLGNCSYCEIKSATGNLKSEPIEELVHQAEKGIMIGEKTIMLMAGDTGVYGKDIGTNLLTLLEKIASLPGDFKLYIHDFGISTLTNNLNDYLNIFNKRKTKIGGMTLPIQSGSDNVLKLMQRTYTSLDAKIAAKSVSKNPFDLGTHIMVGFPGETDRDFQLTLDLLKEVNFDFVTCFPYYEHPIAASASIPKKVSKKEVDSRIQKISKLLGNKIKVVR